VSINDSLARVDEVLCELGNDGFDLVGVVPIAHQAGQVAHAADDTLLILRAAFVAAGDEREKRVGCLSLRGR
jgi:hypothetical protein